MCQNKGWLFSHAFLLVELVVPPLLAVAVLSSVKGCVLSLV